MKKNLKSANLYVILFAIGLIVMAVLIKIFYTGTAIDEQAISDLLGTSKRGNSLSIVLILLMRFFSSSVGYITLLVLGALILLLSIPLKNKKNE